MGSREICRQKSEKDSSMASVSSRVQWQKAENSSELDCCKPYAPSALQLSQAGLGSQLRVRSWRGCDYMRQGDPESRLRGVPMMRRWRHDPLRPGAYSEPSLGCANERCLP